MVMPRPAQKIDTNSDKGRVMLALRAGPMYASQLTERFPNFHASRKTLELQGLIECKRGLGAVYALTEEGRRACPTRRAPCE
jgi:hypothetical protein